MSEMVPMGAVPEEEFEKSPPIAQASQIPSEAIPAEEFEGGPSQYETGPEMFKTAIEQGLSGATLGASKVFETKVLGVDPAAIAARESANPITSTLANIGGTSALLLGTGGVGALAKGVGTAARIGAGALEGAVIGGANQFSDDWSQDKALDGQKIAASATLGSLLGAGGGLLAEGIGTLTKPIAKVAPSVENAAADAGESITNGASPPQDAPREAFKGIRPTSYKDIADRVKEAKINGTAQPLPMQAELDDALSRVPLENTVNPLQRSSLESQQARDIYSTMKEAPGNVGETLSNYEGLQKSELLKKTGQTIQDVSPGAELTSDAFEGGKSAIDAFTDQYQNEKEALSPIFDNLKKLPIQGDVLPESIAHMTQAVPGIAGMFDTTGAELAVKPYKTIWGIDKSTYNAVKEAVDSLSGADNNLESLWNIRKGLDQHVDVLSQGPGPSQIRALKSALMDQMQQSTGNPNIRDAFKRYAINEQQRQIIEKSFGASVGSPEFGQISKIKPELIGDKIFGNSATTEAAKNILPKEQFQTILGNWISNAKELATDKGVFSANKFARFLKTNQDSLQIAFQDNPTQLQRLKDLMTITRIVPDAPSVNPSGTAKTLANMLLGAKLHDVTWEGVLASIPQKIAAGISDHLKMQELNSYLSGQALRNAQQTSLKGHVINMSDKIDKGIRAIFSGSASQTRKSQ